MTKSRLLFNVTYLQIPDRIWIGASGSILDYYIMWKTETHNQKENHSLGVIPEIIWFLLHLLTNGDIQVVIKAINMIGNFKKNIRDLPGGPVAKTLHSQCRRPRFNPRQGPRSHMLQLRPGTAK